MKAQILTVLYNIFVMWLISHLGLLIYCWRSNFRRFRLNCWLKTNVVRFQIGALVITGVAVLLAIVPDAKDILISYGLNPEKSVIPLGIGIGALLVLGIPGNKTEENSQETK